MTTPLALADFLVSKYDLFPRSEQMQAAALLRAQHAEIERKNALLRQCLKHVASNITRDGCEAEELYDTITSELAK